MIVMMTMSGRGDGLNGCMAFRWARLVFLDILWVIYWHLVAGILTASGRWHSKNSNINSQEVPYFWNM
jgi:hypothetical protein